MAATEREWIRQRDASFRLPSPVEELVDSRLADRSVRLLLKRDDLINPEIPGNKWRKLRYNLEAAQRDLRDAADLRGRLLQPHPGDFGRRSPLRVQDDRGYPRRAARAVEPCAGLCRRAWYDPDVLGPYDLPT
ncbi:hypothetical protein GCM10023196_046030 [Actinoallomurus vinaceus]|uniref:Uncharacterized protein n=1 Tax=Actinoallomurus vinaceus TaxID=1080074 RepID=A0ABP8UDQ4_9ACTN